jgi:hypothetical protein
MSAEHDRNYHAYLLRFWRDDAQSPWRIVLIDSHTGEQQGFPSSADLYAFLEEQLALGLKERICR